MKNSILELAEKIKEKSRPTRTAYLKRVKAMQNRDRGADRLGCANVAHAFASLPVDKRLTIIEEKKPNIAVVTAFNDMLLTLNLKVPSVQLCLTHTVRVLLI